MDAMDSGQVMRLKRFCALHELRIQPADQDVKSLNAPMSVHTCA